MTGPSGLSIRPYRPGDEHAILRTFNRVFREVCGPDYVDRTLEQWRWAYLDNPAGHRISLAVAADGTIASQYAGMPMRTDTRWGEQRFVHCVDSMTHPAFRQGLQAKSLFVETCMPFWAHGRTIGDALFFGFPVDAAFRIGQRYLKYELMRAVEYLIRERDAGPLAAPAGLEVARVDAVPPDVGGLYERVRADKDCLVRRDYRYLKWRYVDNPARADYELWTARRGGALAGLTVLKPGSGLAPDSATIVDWLVPEDDADAASTLLAAAVRRQHEQGRQRLLAVFAPWSHEQRTLLAHGFQVVPSSTWLQRRLIHNVNDPRFTPEYLASSWWYTLGDTDLA
jgi:hypothetical protein